MLNKAFLESHIARQADTRKAQLDHIKRNKPVFPPPIIKQAVKERDNTCDNTTNTIVESDTKSNTSNTSENDQSTPGRGKNFISFTKADDLEEYWDESETLEQKAALLAQYIKGAQNCIVFTGAGISTAAKLPDYRSKDKGIMVLKEKGLLNTTDTPTLNALSDAEPTLAHKVVSSLVKKGLCKHVVSTNIDGLHMRSGVPFEKLIELHGNCFLEYCVSCGKQYWRDFSTIHGVEDSQSLKHTTGRTCECGGALRDSIIHFGESLIESELQRANQVVLKMDLAIVLGSSLRVSPACNLPRKAVTPGGGGANGKLVVVNLQKTPFGDETWLHIHGSIDRVCECLAKELSVEY